MNSKLQPDLVAMSASLTATILFGGVMFLMLGMLLVDSFRLSRPTAYTIAGATTLLMVTVSAFRIGRSQRYHSERVHGDRFFHWWQGLVVVTITVFSYLMAANHTPEAAWAFTAVEAVLVLFYLFYISYGLALRCRVPVGAYIGFVGVLASACYAFSKAPK